MNRREWRARMWWWRAVALAGGPVVVPLLARSGRKSTAVDARRIKRRLCMRRLRAELARKELEPHEARRRGVGLPMQRRLRVRGVWTKVLNKMQETRINKGARNE